MFLSAYLTGKYDRQGLWKDSWAAAAALGWAWMDFRPPPHPADASLPCWASPFSTATHYHHHHCCCTTADSSPDAHQPVAGIPTLHGQRPASHSLVLIIIRRLTIRHSILSLHRSGLFCSTVVSHSAGEFPFHSAVTP